MSEAPEIKETTVRAVCDTFLPSLEPVGEEHEDPKLVEYYRTNAAELGIDEKVVEGVAGLDITLRRVVAKLSEWLAERSFETATLEERTNLLHKAADESMSLRLGVRQLKAMTLGLFVNGADKTVQELIWPVIGYPAPEERPATPGEQSSDVRMENITEGADPFVVEADVVVVGSGAGGSVIAARLAQAGRSVVIVDSGPYRPSATHSQVAPSGPEFFLRGGSLWSDSGQMGILAGSAIGGGTLINSMVCLKPPQDIRDQWAKEGLKGLDTVDFDRHIDKVWERLGVNTEASYYNANTRAMVTGIVSTGYSHERLPRNFIRGESDFCCYCTPGCRHQKGHRNSTLVTYLSDAAQAGARFIAECTIEEITTEDSRTTGVVGAVKTPGGDRAIRIEAPQVVVASGGIESPALLLRSGIGGPAVGKNLQLHPAWIVTGVYDEPIEAWHGPIQSAVSFDLTKAVGGEGFLVESLAMSIGTWGGQSPFSDPRATRDQIRDFRRFATWHGVAHDHGTGQVVLDEDRRATLRWSLDDEVDHKVAVHAHRELARMHKEAGAAEIFTFAWRDIRWREGEDFGKYLDQLSALDRRDYTAFSAHQMSSCRLGADPETSVADGDGQLHDVRGVWVGDASALPSAPGVNPMITIMALAERTAEAMLRTAEDITH